ncbi:MAG: hypothetical protein ACK52J_03995, partial [bacterium]
IMCSPVLPLDVFLDKMFYDSEIEIRPLIAILDDKVPDMEIGISDEEFSKAEKEVSWHCKYVLLNIKVG